MSRIILFTGKGGVGKTTCAVATALKASQLGHKTLVMSSDPAHSLSDALDISLISEPTEVAPNLFAMEVDLFYSMKKYWGNIRQLLLLVFKWQGIDEIAAEELAAIPGMEEGSALLWVDQFFNSGEYDLIVIDMAPTGETLTFLTLPQVTEWWITKAFPFQKLAIKSVGYAVRKTTGIPLDKGYKELKEIFAKLKSTQEILSDPKISSIRLVMNPEKMVLQESRRAYTYLQMYGYGVDAVIVNRIIPPETGKAPGWEGYLATQAKYLEEIEQSFAPLPIFKLYHQQKEVFGLELLEKISEEIYGDSDPVRIFYQDQIYKVEEKNGEYWLTIKMPFAGTGSVEASQYGDQLVIQIKNRRQHYFLPKFLTYFKMKEASLDDGFLKVNFIKEGGK